MKDYRKGSHTVHDIKLHFVWITKYRYNILNGDIALRVREIMAQSDLVWKRSALFRNSTKILPVPSSRNKNLLSFALLTELK